MALNEILLPKLPSFGSVLLDIIAKSSMVPRVIKGDGNDGEPDALEKLEMEKKAKNWLELKNCGWLGSYLKNIQSDLPNETRGQS